MEWTHVPVMASEVLEILPLKPGATAVDGTVGLGGHSKQIAERLRPDGILIAIDWDKEMLDHAKKMLADLSGVQVHFVHDDYRQLPMHLAEICGPDAGADAIFLDFGLNNAQIADPTRGISFRENGPLDMRMDRTRGEPASALLNRLTADELERILTLYGDEHWAKRIARVIVDRRKQKSLQTTTELVDCVMAAIPPAMREQRIHPATRTFQAIRIAVNQELEELEEALIRIAACLKRGGVMAVLSYHSGEDRAVKRAFRSLASAAFENIYRKPKTPTDYEIATNPKSRSAKLRAVRRLT